MHEHDIEEDEVIALQPDELIDLEEWLTCDAMPSSAMPLAVMDGFLTGLLCGPTSVAPNTWLPLVWDSQGKGAVPTFADSRANGVLIDLIVQRLMDIEAALSRSADHLVPVYQSIPKLVAGSWCAGFLLAMQQMPDDWAPVRSANAELIATLEEEARALTDAATAALRPDPIAAIRLLVAAALQTWGKAGALARRQTVSAAWALAHDRDPFVREAPKVGRNDACPCGSGKKFKRCCGRDDSAQDSGARPTLI